MFKCRFKCRFLLSQITIKPHTYGAQKLIHKQAFCLANKSCCATKNNIPIRKTLAQLNSLISCSYSHLHVSKLSSNFVQTKPPDQTDNGNKEQQQKLGLIARFKLMWKKYWYVMIPVHLATSLLWFGGFYYMSIRFVRFYIDFQSFGESEAQVFQRI